MAGWSPESGGLSTLAVEEREDRLVVRLDRPAVRNAIDQTMVDELHAVCAHLEAHPKVLILTGTPSEEAAGTKGSSPPGRTSPSCVSAVGMMRWPGSIRGSSRGSPGCRCR